MKVGTCFSFIFGFIVFRVLFRIRALPTCGYRCYKCLSLKYIYIVNTCISIRITFTLLLRMGVGASADPDFFFKWKFAKSE